MNSDSNNSLNGVLQTKLHPPFVSPEIIRRDRLFDLLSGRNYRIALLTAPAGFGKSVCVRSWLETVDQAYAWLSLDERDNSLRRFLTYLVACFRKFDDTIGESSLALLRSDSLPSIETLLTPIINDLYSLSQESIIVIDDYHLIDEPAIHDVIQFLIEQLPPQLKLLLVSRIDPAFPVARYRARGELIEIREQDLRFTSGETGEFLNELKQLDLPEESISILQEKTEGWAAGLQLASLSLQQSPDREAFLKSFSGETGYVLDYLLEEVLNGLDEEVQLFLLQTSILNRFTTDLCKTVTGLNDAPDIITTLQTQNLFLVSLDDTNTWFRYHHLFGDLLQFRLKQKFPQDLDSLHLRASEWLENHHRIESALDHAFQLSDRTRALELLDRSSEKLIMESRLAELQKWIDRLPEEKIRDYPMILLSRAWMQLLSHRAQNLDEDIRQISERLNAQDHRYSEDRKQRIKLFVQILDAFWNRVKGDVHNSIALSEKALDYIPEDQPMLRNLVRYNLARSYMKLGHVQKPSELFTQIVHGSQQSGNYYLLLSSQGQLCYLMIQIDGPLTASNAANEYLDKLELQGLKNLPAASYLFYALGYAEYLRNNIDTAIEALEKAHQLSAQGDDPFIQYRALFKLAWCEVAKGNLTEAKNYETKALQLYQESERGIFASDSETDQLYLAALSNDFARVDSGLRSLELSWNSDFSVISERQAFFKIRHVITQRNTKEARRWSHWLHDHLENYQRNGSLLSLNVLESLIEYDSGEKTGSLQKLDNTIREAITREEIRPFLNSGESMRKVLSEFVSSHEGSEKSKQFGEMLLTEFQKTDSRRIIPGFKQELVSPLTEREQEVLSYLLEGKTYQEIANSLFVSVNTIKTHLKNLYAKLDASSKSEAVEKAKSMGFITSS